MDLVQLKSFVTVARLGHLTRASEAVHLSQPAISAQIKALERDFGLDLFDRTPSGMSLTPAGKRLLGYAEAVIGDAQALRAAAASLRGQVTGHLRLGTVLEPALLRVGELIARNFERHPAVELDLRQVVSHDALEEVRAARLDASFYFGSLPDDLAGIALATIEYRVVIPVALVADAASATWTTVATLPWIAAPERSSHRQLVLDLFRSHGGIVKPTIEADNESVIRDLVEAGVGASVLRREIADSAAASGRMAVWPGALLEAKLWFVHEASRRNDPVVAAIIDILAGVWSVERAARAAD